MSNPDFFSLNVCENLEGLIHKLRSIVNDHELLLLKVKIIQIRLETLHATLAKNLAAREGNSSIVINVIFIS